MDRRAAPFSLQVLVGAAERLRRKSGQTTEEETYLSAVENARDRLGVVPFVAEPMQTFERVTGGKTRTLSSPSLPDRVIEEAIRPKLDDALERLLTDGVHGYRKGRSAETAARALSEALSLGRVHLVIADVEDFFPSMDHGVVERAARRCLPADVVDVVMALVRAPTLEGDEGDGVVQPSRGLALGRPLSPSLSNAVMLPVDEAMVRVEGTYVRYADDVVLACGTEGQGEDALAVLEGALAEVGLRLWREKLRRVRYEGAPVVYLGHAVDARRVYRPMVERARARREAGTAGRPPGTAAGGAKGGRCSEGGTDGVAGPSRGPGEEGEVWPSLRSRTLYVTQAGAYLRVRDGLIEARRGEETLLTVPLRRIDRVLVLTHVAVSSGFVAACVTRRVPVLFFVKSGKAYGALVASGLPNPLRLRAQYDLLMSMGRRTALARSVVEAKIGAMLRRLSNVPEAAEARGELSRIREGLGAAGTPEVLRGHEGAATKSYYRAFATRIRKPGFAFTVRSRRPPRDAVNSLLSFAYALLFAEMQTALLAHGLDPSPALLHDLHRNHLALASDLIEPYRVLIADSFVLWLVNTGQVEAEGFEPRGGGVYMKRETLLAVIAAYEQYMMRRGGGGKGAAPPRWLVDEAARSMLAVVLGERERLELPLVPAGMGEEEGP